MHFRITRINITAGHTDRDRSGMAAVARGGIAPEVGVTLLRRAVLVQVEDDPCAARLGEAKDLVDEPAVGLAAVLPPRTFHICPHLP